MTRHVFDNYQTAHVWAHQTQDSGRSHSGNLFFEGPTLYSYGRHFPVGVAMRPGFYVINADRYSVSTGRHQSYARSATHGRVIELPNLSRIIGDLGDAARGDVRPGAAKRLTSFLVDEGRAAYLDPDAVRALLEAFGSKADPARVIERARAWKDAEKAARLKEEREAYLRVARYAVGQPLAAFVADKHGVRDVGARQLSATFYGASWSECVTEMSRAWKHAKAAGWSKARLAKLRKRVQVLRADIERAERRRTRAERFQRTRSHVATVRRLRGDLSTAEAMARGSLDKRIVLAEALRDVLRQRVPVLGWGKHTRSRVLESIIDAASEALELRRRILARIKENENAEALEAWKRGVSNHIPYGARSGIFLRAVNVERGASGEITGGELQTSGGARVPLTHAVRLFRFLKLLKERHAGGDQAAAVWHRNGERARVGSFSVDRIYASGSFTAGCHYIAWPEVQRLARELDVFDLTPSDAIVKA